MGTGFNYMSVKDGTVIYSQTLQRDEIRMRCMYLLAF